MRLDRLKATILSRVFLYLKSIILVFSDAITDKFLNLGFAHSYFSIVNITNSPNLLLT